MDIDIEQVISTILGEIAIPISENDLFEFISCNSKELQECSGLVFLPSGDGYLMPREGDKK